MREFATFQPQFWTTGPGKKFRGDPEVQLICAYLFTAPGSNYIGIYYLPIETMAHDLGISLEGASKGLRRAIEGAFCAYDEASEHVFVYEMARIQILDRADQLKPGDKKIIGLKHELRKYRESVHFVDFVNRYRKAFHLTEPVFSEISQAPSKPLPSPFEGASLKEKEKEKETEKETETARRCARDGPAPEEEEVWFSVDSVEKLFDAHMRKRKLGRFVLQRTDYDRASKAVDWAQLVAPEQNCSPKEAVDRSMKGYFERALDEEPKLAAKNYPFWGWANNMSGWLKPSGHLSDGYVPATTRENWVPFEDDSAEVLAWAEAHQSRKDGKDVAS